MTFSKHRRQQILTDDEVQGGLFRKLCGQWLLLLLANGIGLTLWLRLFEMPDMGWAIIAEEGFHRYIPVIVMSTILLPAFMWDINRTTHRFAGPIGRLRKALSDAAGGKQVAPLSFRSNDYWSAIATDFNRLVSRKPHEDQQQSSS
ncbi:hypothetical protein SH139x_001271 [Planctomycetaceae bacterium SH139]